MFKNTITTTAILAFLFAACCQTVDARLGLLRVDTSFKISSLKAIKPVESFEFLMKEDARS